MDDWKRKACSGELDLRSLEWRVKMPRVESSAYRCILQELVAGVVGIVGWHDRRGASVEGLLLSMSRGFLFVFFCFFFSQN